MWSSAEMSSDDALLFDRRAMSCWFCRAMCIGIYIVEGAEMKNIVSVKYIVSKVPVYSVIAYLWLNILRS